MSAHAFFCKQLLPYDIGMDPRRLLDTLATPAGATVLEAKWANACATTGMARGALGPSLAGTATGPGWRITVIAMPPSDQPNDPLFMAVVEGGAQPAMYYFERCLDADMHALSPSECVLASQIGEARNHFGTFPGTSVDAFVSALGGALGLPGLQLQAAASMSAPPLPDGKAAAGLLVATGGLPVLAYALGYVGVFLPFVVPIRGLLSLVAIVVTLVWLHRTFVALQGRTKGSAGMAVAGWFIPVANAVLPAVALRDAWRASLGRGGGIAWAWMVAWWLAIAVSLAESFGLQISAEIGGPAHISFSQLDLSFDTGMDIETVGRLYSVLWLLAPAAAYGLLATIVLRVSGGSRASR